MDEEKTHKELTVNILRRTALISGAFAFLLSLLLILNFIQVKRADPINTPAMTVLLEKLSREPGNDQLREEIRELDLLARKAYFTSQWQIRTGGYLLFASVLVVIICLQWISLLQKKLPPPPQETSRLFWENRILHRRWIAYAGLFLVAASLALAFLTYRELDQAFRSPDLSRSEMVESGAGSAEAGSGEVVAVSPFGEDGETDGRADTAGLTGEIPAGENVGLEPDHSTAEKTSGKDTTNNPVIQEQQSGLAWAAGYPSQAEILSNWLTFRGPGGNGVTSDKGYPVSWNGTTGQGIKWKTAIPLQGYNSPVVWKNRLFVSGADATRREVYCLDAASGKILWTTDVSLVPGTPSAVPKTDRETGLAAPTMTTDGRRVYAIFATGDLVALDMEGKLVWSKNLGLPKNHYGHSSSLIMYRDLLLVQWDQSQGASVKAFAGATGELVWNTPRNVKVSWASPVLVNTGTRMELILAADPCVASYDPVSGKELWRVDCISGEVGPSVAVGGGMVFSTNEYATTAGVQLGDHPVIAWELSDYMSDIPSPVANDEYLFLVTSYGSLVCYDGKSGEELWVQELENNVYSSPVIVGEKVYLLDKTGVMHIFRAGNTWELLATAPLGEGSVCTPAFVEGKIYIRGNSSIYCIGK